MTENPQRDWQAEAGRKLDQWLNDGFVRINAALQESGALDSLQRMFTEKGIQEQYLVFDALETSKHFPIPVRTRYILPTYEGAPDPPGDKAYPGITVMELLGLGVRTLDIQFGLDTKDMQKIRKRGLAVINREQDWYKKRPEWWNSSRPAIDMTTDYDLSGDHKAQMDGVAEEGEDKHKLYYVYSWEDTKEIPGVVRATFEHESVLNNQTQKEWENHQKIVQEGLLILTKMIEAG